MAEKKRTNSKSGGKTASQRKPSGKQAAASRAARAEMREDSGNLPAYIVTGCVCAVVAIFLFLAVIGMDGVLFSWTRDLFSGILGRTGFYVLPFALIWITCILAFRDKRRMISRCVCVLLAALCIGSMAQVFYRDNVAWGLSMFKDLYLSGVEGQAAGVICGIVGGGLEVALSAGGTVLFLLAALILCLLTAANMPLGSLIRAYRNRPRPEPLEEELERDEPATVVVNHFAYKHIEKVEKKRQIADFDLPVDGPVELTGEQQDFLSDYPNYPKSKKRSRRDKKEALENAVREFEEEVPAPSKPAKNAALETFDGLPITGATALTSAQESKNQEPAEVKSAAELPFDLGEFPPLTPEAAPETNQMVEDTPAAPGEVEPASRKMKHEEAQAEAAKIGQEVAQKAAEPQAEYCFPPIELLQKKRGGAVDSTEEMRQNSQTLQETLESFKIEAQICNVTRGPSVTRYELKVDKGIRLARITALAADIALALGTSGVRIAAIPDKQSVVGIEVPNKNVTMVPIRDVIASADFIRSKPKTSFSLGKDISGSCVIGDIARLPHLLIAGTTGSGKSVCMNSIIVSLLYKARPDEVKLIMVDPKMVELGIYNGIPHLLIPVVTDPKKAAGALQWAVTEMLRRYRLMSDVGARDVEEYNRHIESSGEGERLPKIVVVIDELADLMLVAAKEVEEAICRIAQMGRASGMHLIVATQRPSANVITGVMKANIPSRIAFAVASAMESRIILDVQGAEKLVGKGDMLYAPLGNGKPKRVQGCFISDSEVEAVAGYVKSHYLSNYNQEVMDEIDRNVVQEPEKAAADQDDMDAPGDELLPAAVDVILEMGQASVSILQRKLKLGYARAARIVDEMEDRGIVGAFQGSKPREILITKEQWAQMQTGQMTMDDDGPVPEEIL